MPSLSLTLYAQWKAEGAADPASRARAAAQAAATSDAADEDAVFALGDGGEIMALSSDVVRESDGDDEGDKKVYLAGSLTEYDDILFGADGKQPIDDTAAAIRDTSLSGTSNKGGTSAPTAVLPFRAPTGSRTCIPTVPSPTT